jgi:integrase/recombinase XerD
VAKSKAKAPAGCYWRGDILWGRIKVNGHERRWPLHTDNPALARQRREAGKNRLTADAHHGDAPHGFLEALQGWGPWIVRRTRPKTVARYACSLGQLKQWLDGKQLSDIDARLIAEIIRERQAASVTNATIKRDLVALSSVLNYAIDQGWIESNPALPRMKRVKEARVTIILPRAEDIELMRARAPGMIKNLIDAAIATGAREEELLQAERPDADLKAAQLTLTGKRGKRRTIDLNPFDGVRIIRDLPTFLGSPLLFWHSAGEDYKNFASQFNAIGRRTVAWAQQEGIDFRKFRFHDLRHLHAIEWLRSGRSIYELQHRLGHASIKTTEVYLEAGYLTYEQQEACKRAVPGRPVRAEVAQKAAQAGGGGT